MSELNRQLFARSVRDLAEGVRHLTQELQRLSATLSEEVTAGEQLRRLSTKFKNKDDGDSISFRDFWAHLFVEADSSADDEGDEEEEPAEDADDAPDEGRGPGRRKKTFDLASTPAVLAVRLTLREPSREGDGFEPHIRYAVIGKFRVSGVPGRDQSSFEVRRYSLRRLVKELRPAGTRGDRFTPRLVLADKKRIRKGSERIECELLSDIRRHALFDLRTHESVAELAAEMRRAFDEAIGSLK